MHQTWSLLFLALACGSVGAPPREGASSELGAAAASPVEAMRGRPLTYTPHARCRMRCREVETDEVEKVLASGVWVPERSRENGACPSHAFEGEGDDGQRLRVVFAACEHETRVVTAVDLGQDWPCSCR